MDLFWIEVSGDGNSLVILESGEQVMLHDYPPQAAISKDMAVSYLYNGKVILVIGTKQGQDIYNAKIKGSLV